jgi:ribosomal protein S18 acetylase RimI-like enzyme
VIGSSCVVRAATADEVTACIELWVDAVAARDGVGPDPAVRDRALAKFAVPRVACVVAVDESAAANGARPDGARPDGAGPDGAGSVVAGFALVTAPGTGRPDDPADAAYISLVAVHPRAQARGIGRTLLAGAVRAARDAGHPRVALHVLADNDRAVRLYETGGFLPTGDEFPHALTGTATRTYVATLAPTEP